MKNLAHLYSDAFKRLSKTNYDVVSRTVDGEYLDYLVSKSILQEGYSAPFHYL